MTIAKADAPLAVAPDRIATAFWRLDVTDARFDDLAALLSPDERVRADRFYYDLHRRRFIAARGLLREALGAHLRVSPGGLRFRVNAHGKPAVAAPVDFPHFSLSHSGDGALLAIADSPVGADIEAIRPYPADVAGAMFSKGENAVIDAAPPGPARDAAFCRVWTCREAVCKAEGLGFALDQAAFEVSFSAAERPQIVLNRAAKASVKPWLLQVWEPAPGFCAAIAWLE
ncbi:MAG: 4'-phosphopantetheinyl transferase superfamily protein [Hyphomicrobiales bacterium]|nr:4'-phosphopantetheinyl transferase superfamily protein [Hyphomicrobiales bacterium]